MEGCDIELQDKNGVGVATVRLCAVPPEIIVLPAFNKLTCDPQTIVSGDKELDLQMKGL